MSRQSNNLLKSTSLLVSSQFLKILIGVVGTKLTAVFLGPAGVGIVGLITNTINLITTATGFGIDFSGVREISLANAKNDNKFLSRKLLIIRRLMLFSSVIAAAIMLVFSKKLSIGILGDSNYSNWFLILSLVFVFNSLRIYYNVKLQGTQNLKLLAYSWLVSSFVTTVFSSIIYFIFREKGIIPVFLITAFTNMLVGFYFSSKIQLDKISVSWKELKNESKDVIKLGIVFSVNSLVGLSCLYILRLYISKTTSPEILGFYEAGIVFSTYYVSFIFSAMSSDFYPRLTAIHEDIQEVNKMVNRQIELTLLIVVPAVLLLYSGAPIIVQLLYSKEFIPVVEILKGTAFALIIKSISWPLAYIVLAKGDRKQFFYQELFADILNIILTLFFFKYIGLMGIGIAQIIVFSFYGVYMYCIVKKKYSFKIDVQTKKVVIISLLAGLVCSVLTFLLGYPVSYYINPLFMLVSIIYSFKILLKRFDLQLLIDKFKKFKK